MNTAPAVVCILLFNNDAALLQTASPRLLFCFNLSATALNNSVSIIAECSPLKTFGSLALAGVTGGTSLLVVNDGFDISCSGGKCGASMEIGSQVKDENYKQTTTAVGSTITVGGDLTAHADNDLNIRGSDLSVVGNGNISADKNINILESQNKTTQSSSHSDTKITAGVQVGNAYVDAASAAKNLVEAGDAVTKATESLKHIQDLHAQGRASAEAVRDAEFNLTMATLNLANAELAAVSSVAGAASAAGTSFGTGMYASGSVNFETSKNSMDLTSTQSVASNLFGNNLTFTSGSDMTQIGSNVGANDTLSYDVGNDLFVGSGTDTYKTTSGSESITAGASIGNNAVQVNAGFNKSQNTASGTTNVNSNIAAQNIVVKTGNDAKFSGANVNADENLTMNIGHDLLVESKQDTDYANGSNWGVNAGVGGGNGNSSGSGGFNVGNSNHDSAWVNDVTELTGKNVDIAVGNKTTLTGGMIAGLDEDGNDTGNLNLTTNELEYSDLRDFNTNSNTGFGFSTSVGGNTDAGIASAKPQGSTTISMTDTGSEAKQTTHATIGGGNITIANGNTDGLNRDTKLAQEITSDLITGALDSIVTVDNRMLSESGRDQIANQHENLSDNVEQIGDGLRNNIVVKSIENYATDDTKSLTDTISDYVQQDAEMTKLQQEKQELVAALNGLTNYDSPEAQKALQQVADFVGENGGFTGDLKLASVDGNVAGFSYKSNDGTVKNITINLANVDMTDPNALMNVIYHETTNFDQHDKSERTAINRGETGSAIFDLKNYGNANTNSMDNGQWLSNYGNTDTVQSGSVSLINDVNNTNSGNGKCNPLFKEIGTLAGGAIGGAVGAVPGAVIGAEIGTWVGTAADAAVVAAEIYTIYDSANKTYALLGSEGPDGYYTGFDNQSWTLDDIQGELANMGSNVALGNVASPYLTGLSSMAESVKLGNAEAKAGTAISKVKYNLENTNDFWKNVNNTNNTSYSSVSTGRATPNNLTEQLVLKEAQAGAGTNTGIVLNDQRFKGWDKVQHVHEVPTGNTTTFFNPSGSKNITIHYNRDPVTGQTADFKFTNP